MAGVRARRARRGADRWLAAALVCAACGGDRPAAAPAPDAGGAAKQVQDERYDDQLVAGYSKTTKEKGLRTYLPDYGDLR
ncbi:MAG TPA: hypothetical protein VNJ70_05465 [Thermoanaerobaculia bacterium]|nr:hypothetical protein [Thermoanaerobaculia bacterium]